MNNTGPIANPAMGNQTLAAPGYHTDAAEAYQPGQEELPQEVKLPGPSHTNIAQKDTRHISLKKQAGLWRSASTKWASAILALLGIAILGISFVMSSAATLSLLLSLEGISLLVISILFYFMTPHKLVQSEVRDAEVASNTTLVNAFLAPIAGDSKGIYVPSSRGETTRVFIPTINSDIGGIYGTGGDIAKMSVSGMDGVLITPPGDGLLAYAKSLGAVFTDQGLGEEIADVLVNGTELASRVEVKREADSVHVRLSGLTGSRTCKAIRQKSPAACCQVGCPVCSFVACMVAEGTGKLAMIGDVKLDGQALGITYKLL